MFVQYDYVGRKKIADELGVQVRVAGPTDFDVPDFIAAVEQACAQNPAGVSVVGGWDPSLTQAVNKRIQLGVATVVDDGDLPDSNRLAYICTNWTDIGEVQARTTMKVLPDGRKVAMKSIINANNMREAVVDPTAYMEAHGGGKAIMAAHPDIKGVGGFDPESGAGIVHALQEAGKQPGEVKVTALEQTPDFFGTLQEGRVDGIVVQDRELFVYYAVTVLHDFRHKGLETSGLAGWGGMPSPPTLDTGVLLVTSENVGKVLTAFRVN